MKISILTMFPDMLASLRNAPIVDHACKKGIVEIEVIDIKKYAEGSFRDIDDSPYGGGAGMILRCAPVLKALDCVKEKESYTVLSAAAGTPYTQKKAHELAEKQHLILICGHYEGVDARIDSHVDEKISMGDYIVSGGEYPAMLIADSIVRLLDGVIKKESTEEESFENGLLEYPQYTKPAEYEGQSVPKILLSGDHEKIRVWRLKESLRTTLQYRPELLEQIPLTEEEKKLLAEIKEDMHE
jgi:tRNA (guanine37-N1)-methyltransferase